MADDTTPQQNVYIESKMPADNGYGQNGYRGPSSDLPGKHTSSNFLPKCSADQAARPAISRRGV
jgi:hypothetical protein